jgi:3-hydroxyacyl-CoA dehydrogenase
MAKGPFAVFDMTGLEIAWARRKREATSRDPKARYVPIADWLCEAGRLGRRKGRGWYEYIDGVPHEDPELLGFLDAASHNRGIPRRTIADSEIVERLLSAMAIEGARLLQEGIIPRSSDIDFVLVNGYGFPAHQGGPMFWADNFGLAKLLRINEMRYALDGPGSEVAPLLARLVKGGTTFAGWQAAGKAGSQ